MKGLNRRRHGTRGVTVFEHFFYIIVPEHLLQNGLKLKVKPLHEIYFLMFAVYKYKLYSALIQTTCIFAADWCQLCVNTVSNLTQIGYWFVLGVAYFIFYHIRC